MLIFATIAGLYAQQCTTIETTNTELLPLLSKLVQTSIYRYFKTNLQKECPFWQEDLLCSLKDCTVIPAVEDEVPEEWKKQVLSQVDYTPSNSFQLVKKCITNDKDFCILDEEEEGEYINLLKNPERYSGYAGPSAARVWSAIYNENCFSPVKGLVEQCHEKQVFYKIISGLHTSISMHICADWLDRQTGHWIRNETCYAQRIGTFPDRIDNLYFYWSIYVRAISKLVPFLENHPFCDRIEDATLIKGYVSRVVETVTKCPKMFHESEIKKEFINDFKHKFRNISKIMDCVGCEKCRLWGKIQTFGLGTALKILFSYKEGAQDLKLTRMELVSLMNAFHRVSESVQYNQEFQKMASETKDSLPGWDVLVWLEAMNSKAIQTLTFWFGLGIVVLGLVRLFFTAKEVEKEYEKTVKESLKKKKKRD